MKVHNLPLLILCLSTVAFGSTFWTKQFELTGADEIGITPGFLVAWTPEESWVYNTSNYQLITHETNWLLRTVHSPCTIYNYRSGNKWDGGIFDPHTVMSFAYPTGTQKTWNGVKGYEGVWIDSYGCDVLANFSAQACNFNKPGEVVYFGDIDNDGVSDIVTRHTEAYAKPNIANTFYRRVWSFYRDPSFDPLVFITALFFRVMGFNVS